MRLTIGTKLGLGFFSMLLLVAAAGLTSIFTMSQLSELTAIMAQDSKEVLAIGKIWENLVKADAALESAVISGTDGLVATARFRQSELHKTTTDYLNSNQSSETETSASEVLTSMKSAFSEYEQMYETYLNTSATESVDLQTFSNNKNEIMSTFLFTLAELEKQANARMISALEEIQQAQSSLLLLMIGITIVAAVLGAALAIGITRSITRPVRYIVEVADKISMGDLDTPIQVTSKDEIGDLQASVERMRLSLKAVIDMLKKKS